MKIRLSLMGDFGEILRIENGVYYILTEDGECLQRVSADKCKKYFLLYEDLYNNTWCKEFKKQYENIKEYLKEV